MAPKDWKTNFGINKVFSHFHEQGFLSLKEDSVCSLGNKALTFSIISGRGSNKDFSAPQPLAQLLHCLLDLTSHQNFTVGGM